MVKNKVKKRVVGLKSGFIFARSKRLRSFVLRSSFRVLLRVKKIK